MALGEFELIDRFFGPLGIPRQHNAGIVTGIGDDAAVLELPPGRHLVATLDTLVEGLHFHPGSPAESVGHRALAVNLSDLAAMGADPAWYLLSLSLPQVDEVWLGDFARGMRALAERSDITLVGGDTTGGRLSVSVQAMGFARPGESLLRSGAAAGDLLFVSGFPGEAAAGLAFDIIRSGSNPSADGNAAAARLRDRFRFPTPRLALGRALRGLASACIDVSDGLAADAGKLAAASGCGASIEVTQVPLSEALLAVSGADLALRQALGGGDDYELCFTVPAGRLAELPERVATAGCEVRCIGVIEPTPGLRLLQAGREFVLSHTGFDHFASLG